MGDKLNHKIAIEDLATLERLLDEVPVHQETEVSKRRAVRHLAPKLQALRAKGYSWPKVAAWLTKNGLPVGVSLLQGYLHDDDSPGPGASRGTKPSLRPARKVDTALTVAVATAPAVPSAPAAAPAAKVSAHEPARRAEKSARRTGASTTEDGNDLEWVATEPEVSAASAALPPDGLRRQTG
jgi:hypothetical protein